MELTRRNQVYCELACYNYFDLVSFFPMAGHRGQRLWMPGLDKSKFSPVCLCINSPALKQNINPNTFAGLDPV